MQRNDISERVVHFTKGQTFEESFSTLCKILNERCLMGGNGLIKGLHSCVCFTETPVETYGKAMQKPSCPGFGRYHPFGVSISKEWLFERGGRPVIYQSDEEYADLPESHCWRHVRYEPAASIDFTWEREWRIKADLLRFEYQDVLVVLPDSSWLKKLEDLHLNHCAYDEMHYGQLFGATLAYQYAWWPFPWKAHLID
jgi:hypothetical protein